MNSLEFYKTVLRKVSFDNTLFNKEYGKAMRELSSTDRQLLMQWCSKHFKRSGGRKITELRLNYFHIFKCNCPTNFSSNTFLQGVNYLNFKLTFWKH